MWPFTKDLLYRGWREALANGSSTGISVIWLGLCVLILGFILTVGIEWLAEGRNKAALKYALKSWKSSVGAVLAFLVGWIFLFGYSTLSVAYKDHQNLVIAAAKTCAQGVQETPKDSTQSSVLRTKEPPKIITEIKQSGKGNTANPGSIAAPINQGPCGVVQNGGSNNVASPNCTPPDRHLTDEQIEAVHKVIQSLPDSVKVMVETIAGNGEALRFAQQFQDTAVQCGKSGNPKAVILGITWRQVPVGLWIVSRSDDGPVGPYRAQLTQALSSKDIPFKLAGAIGWRTKNSISS